MKVVFISNYYNHHQAPFCEEMYKRLGKDFAFIQTQEMELERINMGWGEEIEPSFLKKSYGDNSAESECQALVNDADVVIIGSAPERFISERIKTGKIVIRYQERLLKQKVQFWKLPYLWYRLRQKNPAHANVYLLCASAFAASDYAKFGLFKDKCYKWGYFPEVKKYDIDQLITKKKPMSILWVARMIDWKHPEMPILVAKRLRDDGYDFQMKLIGNGVLESNLREMISDFGLSNCVKMLGAMKPERVREYMEQSEIFLATSDRNEGWGAVINEAMNSGCCVVADDEIGAAPYLIKNGNNGLLYKDGDDKALYSKVKELLDDPQKAKRIGKSAYETMINTWNAQMASERLLSLLVDLIENKESHRYSQGPCSKA